MNRLLAALFFLSAATLYAGSPSIRCGYAWDQPESDASEPDWQFEPMDKTAFQTAFHGARQSPFGSDVFFATRKDEERDDREISTVMIGIAAKDGKFFRLVAEFDRADGELQGLPEIVRVANDPPGPVFLLAIETIVRGANTATPISRKLIVTLLPKPRVAAFVECSESGGGGACTAFDAAYSSRDALQCDWSRKISDYLCTSTHAYPEFHWTTHRAERRFTLIGGKALPVTRPGTPSFHTLQELGLRLRTDYDLNQQRVIVEGIGLLAPLNPQAGLPLYAAPGLEDDMELRLFAFPREGPPVLVPLHKIVDGHEDQRQDKVQEGVQISALTPTGEQWTVVTGRLFPMGSVAIFPIVLHDGEGRGLFWLAVDRSAKPPAMSLLRLAADVGPYDSCRTFMYPASVSAVTIDGDHAEMTIEPHSRRGEDGGATTRGGEDELPCHVKGTVTWDRPKGFFLTMTDVPCQPAETRVAVVIDAHGHVFTALLPHEKEQ